MLLSPLVSLPTSLERPGPQHCAKEQVTLSFTHKSYASAIQLTHATLLFCVCLCRTLPPHLEGQAPIRDSLTTERDRSRDRGRDRDGDAGSREGRDAFSGGVRGVSAHEERERRRERGSSGGRDDGFSSRDRERRGERDRMDRMDRDWEREREREREWERADRDRGEREWVREQGMRKGREEEERRLRDSRDGWGSHRCVFILLACMHCVCECCNA